MTSISERWTETLRAALVSGSSSSLLSTFALMLLGRAQLGDAAAPVNGPSQWLWGRHAPLQRGFSWRYTFVGYLTQHAASVFWAIFFERARRRLGVPRTVTALLGAAAATSATAAFVDYKLTPPRLRPGYERVLSRSGLVTVYAALAVGLALGALIWRR